MSDLNSGQDASGGAAPRKARPKKLSKRAAAVAAAREGTLPAPPDFSAATHRNYRSRLDHLIALAQAGDIERLRAYEIRPTRTSAKMLDTYRNLVVMALEARAANGL